MKIRVCWQADARDVVSIPLQRVDECLFEHGHRPLLEIKKTFSRLPCPAGPSSCENHARKVYHLFPARSPYWQHDFTTLFSTRGTKCGQYLDPAKAEGRTRSLGRRMLC